MDRRGNITIVEPHEVPMMSQLSDDEKSAYYKSVIDNPDMPARVRRSFRAKLAKLESAMEAPANKRRKAS
jgi:hypothetical protein